MPKDRSQPTDRQREYLTFIQDFTDRWGIPPSFEEIGDHFTTTPPSVNSMIKTLDARGFLARVPGRPRTLRVLVPLSHGRKARSAHGSDPEIEAATRLGSMVMERLVPALEGVDPPRLDAALDAVRGAVDIAIVGAGGSEEQRAHALDALRRTAITAKGMIPESGPRARRWRR